MVISFYKETEWKDGKLPLEDQVSLIVSAMEVKARKHKEEMLRWLRKAELREEERRIEREQEERKAYELAPFKRLLDEAQEWHRIAILLEYIDKVGARATATSGISEDLKTWLFWAWEMADAHDPQNKEDKPT